ncbi:MAG TPA: hypothetical protein VJ385_23320 [Fibrobacteria bacterium]|nr:hypothetical protein [Fibrobacteria bacterium]
MVKPDPNLPGRQDRHPSRLRFAGFLAGKADPMGPDAFELHVRGCARCASLLEEARSQTALFARRHPTLESLETSRILGPRGGSGTGEAAPSPGGAEPPRIGKPAGYPGWNDRIRGLLDRALGWRPALAGFALLGLAVLCYRNLPATAVADGRTPSRTAALAYPAEAVESAESDFTAKGQAGFYLFRNGKQIHTDTLFCKPSDTLQLGIASPEPVHYALLYRDDGGSLEVYLGAGARAPLGTPTGENLPNSLILDAGWRRESLYCLWSRQSFSLEEAKAKVLASEGAALNAKGPEAKPLRLHTYILLDGKP